MNKNMKIMIIVILIIVAIAICGFCVFKFMGNGDINKTVSNIQISNEEEMTNFIEDIYAGIEDMPMLETSIIDCNDIENVYVYTGLNNGDELEMLAVSQSLINAQAYEVVVAKVKPGIDAKKIAEDISNNVDMRRWICVSAEKLYSASTGDIVFMVMADKETAGVVYNNFKKIAKTVDAEFTKDEEVFEMPEDPAMMYNPTI